MRTTPEASRTAEFLTQVPLDDGGIQIELHAGGIDLEVLINAEGRVEGVSIDFLALARSAATEQQR